MLDTNGENVRNSGDWIGQKCDSGGASDPGLGQHNANQCCVARFTASVFMSTYLPVPCKIGLLSCSICSVCCVACMLLIEHFRRVQGDSLGLCFDREHNLSQARSDEQTQANRGIQFSSLQVVPSLYQIELTAKQTRDGCFGFWIWLDI